MRYSKSLGCFTACTPMSSMEEACDLTGVVPPKEKDGASRTPFSAASRLMASAVEQC